MIREAERQAAKEVRQIYEERPYPAADESTLRNRRWRLAPLPWINAIWCRKTPPARVLIAGCGTGHEAFQVRRRLPEAEITAVDFSPRSISIARELQQRNRAMRDIRFIVADLTSRALRKTIGQDVDFISCHGVLSYIPAPERALANLARCLSSDGALYLGVNGTQHSSVAGRQFLSVLGFDMACFRDGSDLRRLLKLSDAILDAHGRNGLANKAAGYLAGDLFGSVIHNLPLSRWVRMASGCGLHFQGSFSSYRALRRAMEDDFPRLLMPRSRPELCELLEILSPAAFHRLLFTREPASNPPWNNFAQLLRWRPVRTGLYTARWPKRTPASRQATHVTMRSPATNTRLDWRMPPWEVELLREANGQRTLGALIETISLRVPAELLQQQLYTLHQLLVINVVQ